MSYSVRDDNSIFGQLAAVEMPNGAGASTIGCIQNYEPAGLFGLTATTFAANSFNTVFIAPPAPTAASGLGNLGAKWQIIGISYFYHTAGGAGSTFTVETVPAGTADGSGNNALSVTNVSLATAASNTPVNLGLSTNVDNLQVSAGGRININAGSSATTGLANFSITVFVARIA